MTSWWRISLGLAAALGEGCAASGGTGHETHWLNCSTPRDCPSGYTCADGKCENRGAPPAGAPDAALGPPITNPTGSCVAPDDGARPGYSSPGPGTVWLPDCRNTLRREYWRVYAVSPDSAYILPRPDGSIEIAGVCDTTDHPLRPIAERYRLCGGMPSKEDVAVINDMRPADALALTHYLHTQLLFMRTDGASTDWIRPFPLPSDVVDACALHPDTNSPAVESDCALERRVIENGSENLTTFVASAEEMVALLNELYGIGDCAKDEVPQSVCLGCGPAGGCATSGIRCAHVCGSNDDCGGARCWLGICQIGAACI